MAWKNYAIILFFDTMLSIQISFDVWKHEKTDFSLRELQELINIYQNINQYIIRFFIYIWLHARHSKLSLHIQKVVSWHCNNVFRNQALLLELITRHLGRIDTMRGRSRHMRLRHPNWTRLWPTSTSVCGRSTRYRLNDS